MRERRCHTLHGDDTQWLPSDGLHLLLHLRRMQCAICRCRSESTTKRNGDCSAYAILKYVYGVRVPQIPHNTIRHNDSETIKGHPSFDRQNDETSCTRMYLFCRFVFAKRGRDDRDFGASNRITFHRRKKVKSQFGAFSRSPALHIIIFFHNCRRCISRICDRSVP